MFDFLGDFMPAFIMILGGFFIVNTGMWLIRIGLSYAYICKAKAVAASDMPDDIKIVILIPVLNEEKRIRRTIEMCSRIVQDHVEIVFATSSKERKKRDNTIAIIDQYRSKYSWIKAYKYEGDGYMAHQLNYALKAYCEENPVDGRTLFAVYNIDSVITKTTLFWVAEQYLAHGCGPVIYQQYGYYCKNWKDCEGQFWINKAVLWSNMLWQTRWSIGFEMAHALMGLLFCKKNIWFMNYCIGHGLFFNKMVYDMVGGFEEKSLNEDAIFGLKACLNNIKIIPVPWLERADSPDSVFSLFRQKITWIYGPGQAFEYGRFIKGENKTGKGRLLWLCMQLFEHAIRWILVPVIVAAAIVCSFFCSISVGIVIICLILFYLAGLNLLTVYLYDKNNNMSFKEMIYVILGCIPQFLLHGLSGWCGIFQLLGRWLFGKKIIKRKTEMRA